MPSGFVRRVFQDEGIDLETYRLSKPNSNCNCVYELNKSAGR